MLNDLLYRLRSVLFRRSVERELADELDFHLEHEIEKYTQRGLSEQEARRLARLNFGGADQIKEQCRQSRGVGLIESIAQDIRHSIRSLRKSAGFAAGAVLTLALCLATTIIVFSVLDSALLNPVPFKDADRLVRIYQWSKAASGGPFQSTRLFLRWREQRQIFEQVEAHSERSYTMADTSGPESIPASNVSVGLFRLLGVRPQIGRDFNEDESNAPVVLIGSNLWARRFDRSLDVLGRQLGLNDQIFTIVGVMPEWFRFPSSEIQLWTPLDVEKLNPTSPRAVNPVAKIRRGLKLQDADSQVAALAPQFDDRLQNAPGGGATSRLQPMDRYAVNGLMGKMRFVQDRRTVIFVIFGAGILVFIVGCANAANLFLSRSVSRTREAAVRAALGAGRLRLIRYFLAESLLIGLAGGAVGTLLASAGIRALLHVVPPNLIRDSLNPMHMNARAAVWALIASIATGLIVGAMPAVRAFRNDITSAIRGGTAPARRDGRFRGVIVALEGALAMILLIGAGLTLRTLWTLIHVDPGWSASGTLIVEPKFTADRYRGAISMTELEKQTVAQTRLLPGVHAVALAAVVPLLNPSISFGTLESDAVSIPNATVAVNEITGDYFRTLGIPLIAGRSFQTEPAGPGGDDLHNVIVTRDMAARLWPEGNAVGQRLRFRYGPPDSNDWLMVIGVVGDVQTFAFDSPGEPIELYRILPASNRARWITVKTGSNATSREVRDIIRSLDPNLAVDIRSMDEIYDGTLAAPRFQTILFSGFAILTLCLAMSGLYAVVGYEAKRQTREIGIRIALGAGRWAVVGHVVRGFLLLCGLGIIGGMLAGLVLTRWMSAMIYAVRPNDPATFGIAAILLVLAALIGCFVPAYRASRANPAAVLRAD